VNELQKIIEGFKDTREMYLKWADELDCPLNSERCIGWADALEKVAKDLEGFLSKHSVFCINDKGLRKGKERLMSRSGNWFIASTQGADCTLYAAMRKMGVPLTPSQEACQSQLEKMYPGKEVKPNEKSGSIKDS